MNNQIIFNQAIRTTTETLKEDVELIMKDYVVHDDLKGFATDSQITAIQATVALMGTDLAVTTAMAGKAAVDIVEANLKIAEQNLKIDGILITVGEVEAQNTANTVVIEEIKTKQIQDEVSMLENSTDIQTLKGTAADLTVKEEQTEIKATNAQTTANDALGKLKTFITSQAAADAALTALITGLSQTKADAKDTYSKGDIDAQQQLQDGRLDILEQYDQTSGEVYKQRLDNIDTDLTEITNRLTVVENVDMPNIQNRCTAIESVNTNQDTLISQLSGGVNGQLTRVVALETLTNNWTPIMNCWNKPQDGWFQIQNDPTLHWDKINGFVQNKSMIINPKVDIYFGANNEYGAVPDRIILMSQKTIINPDRMLLHLFNTTLNQFEDKSIVQLFNEKIGQKDLTEIISRVGVVESRCNQIDELNQTQTNNISSLQNFQASQIQINSSNATSITNLTNSVSVLQTDNTTNKGNISTLQNQMASVIGVNTNQSTLITNLQNQFNGLIKIENYYADNYSMTIGGFITLKWGEVDVGSAGGQKKVTFATPFSACVYAKFASVVSSTNSGGGADVGYAIASLTDVTITADYANSGGNESNVYSWLVIGW
ncbi:Hypothetical_protein [Hexamita inflata]|uniref:Hypothetical_protein n=1 Tax=Hexamita inflata TaxID=28002 RepID=A0AA86P9U5_9EUKA|nr:Hypothetical protein HINF_LOCUS22446 [Hexamita inflata]